MKKIVHLIAALLVISCSGPKNEVADTSEINYSEEIARIISKVTAGKVPPSTTIEVVFTNSVVSKEQLDQSIDNPFSFSPSVKGEVKWTKTNVLTLFPSSPLDARANYSGKLNLKKLSDTFTEAELPIKFYVEGQEIVSFQGDLELQNPSNPLKLVYQGKIIFSQPTTQEALQKASSLTSSKLSWNQESDKVFSFISDPISRENESKNYQFVLSYKGLDLSESLERTVTVTPLNKLSVSEVEKDEQGRTPKISVKFSDQLDSQQKLDGFVRISPEVDFKLQQFGKYLILDGGFKFGTEYEVRISEGIKSRWGTKTEAASQHTFRFADIAPQVEFASNGIFMPTSNNKQLQFLTTNLRKVHVEVKKVFDENLQSFMNSESLKSKKDRNDEFNNTYVSSVGAIIYNQTLDIGSTKNEWLLHNLALDEVFKNFSNGFYLIRINFNPADVLVPIDGDQLSYIQQEGQIYKPLTISNIGLLAKRQADNQYTVFATDIITGKPMSDVKVSLIDYDDTNSGTTNSQGMVTIKSPGYYVDLIKAEKNDQVSVIKPYEMQWNTSGFDVSGISTSDLKTRGFTYTERGVYRPGDTVNLSCIVRYESGSGYDDIPAYLKLYNPEGTLVVEQTYKNAKDGFYNFTFGTDQNDPTGTWNAQINVGNKYFYHNLKIETVVANRLKVKVTPEVKTILPGKNTLAFDVESKYLFGAPAKGLSYSTEVEVMPMRTIFPKYTSYTFFNQSVEFQNIKSKIKEGYLSETGTANLTWNIPYLGQAPSPLSARITASVQEEGGRPNESWTFVDVHPFAHYLGLSTEFSYVNLNSRHEIPFVMVTHEGESVAGKEVVYRIYRNDHYWWYQYDSYRDFKLRFKTDKHSVLIEEGTITSGKPFGSVPFQPSQSGQYLIEIQDATVTRGHTSSIFVSAYPYGSVPSSDENAGTLRLRANKETFNVGESATITFPSPRQGMILVTVEQGNEILSTKWVDPEDKEEMNLSIPVSASMVPNAYVTITALQTHAQTLNNRPIRMFGILPIQVMNPDTRQEITIDMPGELAPKQEFDIDLSTTDGRPTQFTIAVVDEGLLDLTNFQTPDPWKAFYRKIQLEIQTFDLFGHVIGANEEAIFKTFSIGGDMDYRESQQDPFEKKKRFKPVCLFQGPIQTNGSGHAKVHFTMPNYVGSVRVMVIGARDDYYASAEKTVTVKSDLIIEPTIPRALKPGDEFDLPVNLFATKDNLGKVTLALTTEGPLEVIGKATAEFTFTSQDDQLITFKVKVKEAIGQSKIVLKATGSTTESSYDADVPVSPSAPRVYQAEEKSIKPGQTISFVLPKIGLDGTNNARLNLAVFPNMDFTRRLEYLIHYPYGCIEQTTSSVFPQLLLKNLIGDTEEQKKEIDRNIVAGIDRLRSFQLSDGGFSYWPGGEEASTWGSNYAGQFLIEARKLGYVVPESMYDGIIRYLERETRKGSSEDNNLMTRVNRCYILALAGKAPMNEMNLLKQNEYEKLNSTQKWQLVTAYKLAGAFDKVQGLVNGISKEVEDYNEFGNTYGSRYRDIGIILRCLVILERGDDAALMAKYVAETLSSNYWYSTQTVGQMLLGIGSYFQFAGISSATDLILEGTVTLPDGTTERIKSVNKYSLYINSGYGKELKVSLDEGVKATQLYASVSANGVPLKDPTTEQNKNISLNIDWYNEDGESIEISQVKQGDVFYGHFQVSNKSVVPVIEEMALVQLLPSGWEIENTRLNGELMPSWMQSWTTGNEEYLDIRDDRIMWFFDLYKTELSFVVKLNAITAGTYELPGARCEAMYNNDFVATKAPQKVKVVK